MESLVIDIPAGDGKIVNLFLQCEVSCEGCQDLEYSLRCNYLDYSMNGVVPGVSSEM